MSKKKVTHAYLPEYWGPVFPDQIEKLNDYYAQGEGWDGNYLSIVAKLVVASDETPNFIFMYRLHGEETSDGYPWFVSLNFEGWGLHNGQSTVLIIKVMLPQSTDRSKTDESMADRSIAVYFRTDYHPTVEGEDDLLELSLMTDDILDKIARRFKHRAYPLEILREIANKRL